MKDTLKYLRQKNSLSQNKVADYLGISRQMYVKYESGETEPTVNCVRELSRLYKVSYDVLIDDKHEEKVEYSIEPESAAALRVGESHVSYSAGTVKPDSMNYRQVMLHLFKLNTDDLIRIASKALLLVEEKKDRSRLVSEPSQEEKLRLFNKFNGYIKDVKIEDWKAELMKALDERHGI